MHKDRHLEYSHKPKHCIITVYDNVRFLTEQLYAFLYHMIYNLVKQQQTLLDQICHHVVRKA